MYSVKDNIIEEKHLYAHIDDDKTLHEIKKRPELISEHLERTLYFFDKLLKEKHVGDVIQNMVYNLKFQGEVIEEEQAELIEELFVNAVYLHDMGKINPAFQYKKMRNKDVHYNDNPDAADSNHSLLSALIYIDIYLKEVNGFQSKNIKKFLRYVLLSFAYVISRHHTYLGNMEGFLDDLERQQERIIEEPSYVSYYRGSEHIRKELKLGLFGNGKIIYDKHDAFEFYVLTKLLYSTVVSCDFYATYYYDTGKEPKFNYLDNVEETLDTYHDTEIYKGIQEFKRDNNYFGENSINSLRSQMFIEAEDNLLRNINNNIFYLEAPTGGGKTNISINLGLNIVKHLPKYNKITYIFPFNTLVEQTKKVFNDIFNKSGDLKAVVINSVTPIVTEKENDKDSDEYEGNVDYKKDYLNRQMLQYPVVLTTHISLFNYLFGTGREINLPLIHFCNSVIIMDEIQSYRNDIWPEIIKFLNAYSKLLNIKIIIMSATLPKLDELLKDNKVGFFELIKNKNNYYRSPLFKDRVSLKFDLLLDTKTTKEQLINKIDEIINERNEVRLLIEFIKKTTAREFSQILKDKYPNKNVVELTGDDSNFIRSRILKMVSDKDISGDFVNKNIIVVATQVIEAGVDIDMDVGLKDISLLDGEEQFLGRINRSCRRKNCEAYFFNLDEAENVYKKDLRLEKDLTDKKYKQFLRNKNFSEFYSLCFQRLDDKKKENNSNNIKRLDEAALYLNFVEVNNIMQLIVDENYQIYLSHVIDVEDGKKIEGALIWCEYKKLIEDKDMDYSKRKIRLSELSEKMSYFTYNYCDYKNKFNKEPKYYKENIGRLYFIEDGENFITEDGKFDRKKYDEYSGGKFL